MAWLFVLCAELCSPLQQSILCVNWNIWFSFVSSKLYVDNMAPFVHIYMYESKTDRGQQTNKLSERSCIQGNLQPINLFIQTVHDRTHFHHRCRIYKNHTSIAHSCPLMIKKQFYHIISGIEFYFRFLRLMLLLLLMAYRFSTVFTIMYKDYTYSALTT